MKIYFICVLLILVNLSFSTICRDGSICPGVMTCCLTPHGVGCCPFENATCCGDGVHCCPYGYMCSGISCRRGSELDKLLEINQDTDVLQSVKLTEPEKKAELMDFNSELYLDSEFTSPHDRFPSIEHEINLVISCIEKNHPLESSLKDSLLENCNNDAFKDPLTGLDDVVKKQKCKFVLLNIIDSGMIRSMDCYERIKALIQRLGN